MSVKIEQHPNFKGITSCPMQYILAINDVLNILSGKWKLPIIAALIFEKKRFTDIKKMIPKITSRMLSKELKELEMNGIINRNVYDTIPVLIEYQLTDSGKSIRQLLETIIDWGLYHRDTTLAKDS